MCTPALAAVAYERCPTRPGLKSTAWIAFADDVTSIGAAVNHEVATITMVATKVFYPMGASRKDNGQDSTPNENGGYTTNPKFFITKQTAAKHKIFTSMNQVEAFIVITEDQNGQKDIVGSKEQPCKATIKATKTPKNGYEVEIMWEEHSDLPFVFTGTVPV